ncbi:MAG: hypothetical protein HQ522_12940 [Bacteroidetes bacterium]|nr:hypothetical protein [Bacteroidota bacterium]
MLRLVIITLFLSPLLLSAQKSPTYLSIEGGGTGITGSVNVAKPLIIHPRYKLIFQWGLGLSSKVVQSKPPVNIPAQLFCSFGRRNSFFDVGVGSSLVLGSKLDKTVNEPASTELYLSPIIGFRHESRKWFVRFYACPLFHAGGESLYNDLTSDFVNIGVGIGTIF